MAGHRHTSGTGRKFSFHGAFKKKSDAMAKEKHVNKSHIQKTKIKGQTRFVVEAPLPKE